MSSLNNDIQMDITDLLQQTNDINDIYCNMFDSFFMQRIGERIDYKSLLNSLNECITAINSLSDENTKLQGKALKDIASNKILIILKEYQSCLEESIVKFDYMLEHLYKKSEGIGRYSIFEYNTAQKTLKKLEQKRVSIGNVLQMHAVPYMANARRAR